MRKVLFTILAVLAIAFILPACSTTDSLEDAIQELPTDTSYATDDDDNRKVKR
ncbi:MAG: hypothetical protein WBA74_05290 [Cyclobacteriaceae bacterium]